MTDQAGATKPRRTFSTAFSAVYPLDVAKVERKGRTKDEQDTVIRWLTSFDEAQLAHHLEAATTFIEYLGQARLQAEAGAIKGVVCGVRVKEVANPLMRQIQMLDKPVDELAKGRAMDRVLRVRADG